MGLDMKLQEDTSRLISQMNAPEKVSLVGYNLLGLGGAIAGYLMTQDASDQNMVPAIIAGFVAGGTIGGAGGEILGLYMQNKLGSEMVTKREHSPRIDLTEKLKSAYRKLVSSEPEYSEFKYHQDLSMDRRVLAAYRLRNHLFGVEAGQNKRKIGYLEEKRIDPIHLLDWASNRLKERCNEDRFKVDIHDYLASKADEAYKIYELNEKQWRNIFIPTFDNFAFLLMASADLRQPNIDARFVAKTFDENSETKENFLKRYDIYVSEHSGTKAVDGYHTTIIDEMPPSMLKGFIRKPY